MTLKSIYSPNFGPKRRKNDEIKYIIIHYTGMQSMRASITRLINTKHKVSCHYLISRAGLVMQMVEENKVAWHAGKSKWKKINNLNQNSIGVELINKGHKFGYEKFTKKQITNLMKLIIRLKKKYKIKNSCILGHSDIAPLRKIGPGEKFPWKLLSKKKIGIWYLSTRINYQNLKQSKFRNLFFKNLYKIGYRYFNKKNTSKINDKLIVKAFQRRFRPKKISGLIDQETLKISHFLAIQN